MIDRLPLNALRAFVFAARDQSFKTAARRLHVTPGAISRQIRRLEHELGGPVFERAAHGVTLTPLGARLARIADDTLTALAQGFETARLSAA